MKKRKNEKERREEGRHDERLTSKQQWSKKGD